MSSPSNAGYVGSSGVVKVDGKEMPVGDWRVDGIQQSGVWTTQLDDRVRQADAGGVSGEAESHPVSEKALEAARKAWLTKDANDKWLRSSGMQGLSSVNATSAWSFRASGTTVRRTEIAIRLLGEMLRARIPSAEAEADFAVAMTRLAIEGDGERMTKLAFFLADQVLAEENVSVGNH